MPAMRAGQQPSAASAASASGSGGDAASPAAVVPRRTSADGAGEDGSGYALREKLGSGSYGVVYKAVRRGRGGGADETVVVKKISLGGLSAREQADALNEVKVMASLDHPNVVKYFDSFIGTHGARAAPRRAGGGARRARADRGPRPRRCRQEGPEHRHGVRAPGQPARVHPLVPRQARAAARRYGRGAPRAPAARRCERPRPTPGGPARGWG